MTAFDPGNGMRRVRSVETDTREQPRAVLSHLLEAYASNDFCIGLARGKVAIDKSVLTSTLVPLGATYSNQPVPPDSNMADTLRSRTIRAAAFNTGRGFTTSLPIWTSLNLQTVPNSPGAQVNPDSVSPIAFAIEDTVGAGFDPGAATPVSGVSSGNWFNTGLAWSLADVNFNNRGMLVVETQQFTDISVLSGGTIVQSMGIMAFAGQGPCLFLFDLFAPVGTLQVRARTLDGSVVPTDFVRVQALEPENVRCAFAEDMGQWSIAPPNVDDEGAPPTAQPASDARRKARTQ